MSKSNTLEDFIKTYVENKRISSSPESYSDWLKSYGIESKKILNNAVSDISADYERAKSSYGSNAEALSSLGLTSSGYSDYLGAKAFETMQKRKAGAFNQYSENEEKNRLGYREYVANALKEQKASEDAESQQFYKTVSDIVDAGIRDSEKAYKLAIESGLSSEKATEAASIATEIGNKRLAEDALSYIISHGFNKTQAREYALAVGLSDEEADSLSAYADKINSNPYYSTDYLEYLKNKEKEYK